MSTRSKKIVLIASIGIILLFYFYWSVQWKPSLLFNKTRFLSMRSIGNGIALFNGKYNRLPKSLGEVVSAGFLPEKSELYYCPVKHGAFSSKELSYNECEFTIMFEPNTVVISIPKEIFNNVLYRRVKDYARKWEIPAGCKAYE